MALQRDLTPEEREALRRGRANARRADGRASQRQSNRFSDGLPSTMDTPISRQPQGAYRSRDAQYRSDERQARQSQRANGGQTPRNAQRPSANQRSGRLTPSQRRAEAEQRYRSQPRAPRIYREERERREAEERRRLESQDSFIPVDGARLQNLSGRREPINAQGYSRYGYVAPKKTSRVPIIVIAAIVVIALAAFVAFGLPALTGSHNASSNTAASTTNTVNVTNTDNMGKASDSTAKSATTSSAEVNSAAAENAIVMTLSGDYNTYVLKGEEYLEPGAHAVENYSADITSSIEIEGKVDTSKAGDYSVTYTATSSTGLKLSRTRTVHVVDTMEKATHVPVLMYHYVYSADDPPETIDNNYILDTDLEEQLQYLTQNNYYYPSYQELRAFIDGKHTLPAKSVILTFDDGEMGFLHYGALMLEKYKVPATSFLVGVDNIGPRLGSASPYVIFQSHSYNMHRTGGTTGAGGVISAMTQSEIAADLQKNIDLLGSADAFAYPFGDTTEEAQAAVKQVGILCAFTVNYGSVHVGDDPTKLDRVRVLGSNDLDYFVASLG